MYSKSWDKQNKNIRNIGLSLALGIPITLATNAPVFGFGHINPFLFLAPAIPGFILTVVLMRRFSNMIIRIVHVEYKEIVRDIQWLLQENGLQASRKVVEEKTTYSFADHNLTMIIVPYSLPKSLEEEKAADKLKSIFSDEEPKPQVASVSLQIINADNQAFVEELATLIDGLATRKTAVMQPDEPAD